MKSDFCVGKYLTASEHGNLHSLPIRRFLCETGVRPLIPSRSGVCPAIYIVVHTHPQTINDEHPPNGDPHVRCAVLHLASTDYVQAVCFPNRSRQTDAVD